MSGVGGGFKPVYQGDSKEGEAVGGSLGLCLCRGWGGEVWVSGLGF